MKRITAALLVIATLLGLAGCSKKEMTQDGNSVTVKSAEEAIAYMAEMSDTYGYENAASELTESDTSTIDGDTYYRLQQNYQGIPVYGRTAVYVTDEAGNQIAVTGNLCDVDESISLTPTITQAEAEERVNAYIEQVVDYKEVESVALSPLSQSNLCIFLLENDLSSKLVYKADLSLSYGDRGTASFQVIIDALDATVYKMVSTTLSNIVSVPMTDTDGNNCTVDISTVKEGETEYYTLIDPKRRIRIYNSGNHLLEWEIYDGEKLIQKNNDWQPGARFDRFRLITKLYSNPWYSERIELKEPVRTNIVNGSDSLDLTGLRLLFTLQTTYDFYHETLGLDGIAWDGLWINGVYNNSEGCFYNAYCWGNAKYANSLPDVLISISSLCPASIDKVAHEYAHAVEQCRSGMIYSASGGETGCIMEGISDVFGELVEDWSLKQRGQGKADWISSPRNIAHPSKSGNPTTVTDKPFSLFAGEDFGHKYSTVISHAAYLMWNGIDETEEKKLSTEELAKLWYRAMLMMPSDCNFATCRTLVELAAQSMGLSDKKRECVAEAFDTVGIPTNGVPIYTVQSTTKLYVFDFEQKLCKDYKLKISPAVIGADGAHYIGATHEYYVENREYNTLNLSKGLYAVILEDAGNTNNKFGFILIVTDSEDEKNVISIYTDFGWSSAILDAYKETCDFYVKWVDGGGHAWRGPSDDYVETYELGNVSSDTTDYFEKHCRTYDENITTVAQLKEGLDSHFTTAYADDFFKRLDPVEDNGSLYTYYGGPWGSGWESVDKIESIEKTGDHTCVLTVSGNGNGGRLYGKIACEYKDGQYHFYPSVESLYDEDGNNVLPGEFAFFLASDADLSLPLGETSAPETTEPSTLQPEATESGGLVSVEVIRGDTQRVGVYDVTVDTLLVEISGNKNAAEKIMRVFEEWKEKALNMWADSGGYSGSESGDALGFDQIELTVTRTDSTTISVLLFETTYHGGNLCIHSIRGYTFSTQSGDVLALSDLSADGSALKQALRDACWNQLVNASEYSHLTSRKEGFDCIFSEETYEWTLDSDGIHVYLPEYSLGSHADGIISFVVPYHDLTAYLYNWVIPK